VTSASQYQGDHQATPAEALLTPVEGAGAWVVGVA
jgi:hypothetical protein